MHHRSYLRLDCRKILHQKLMDYKNHNIAQASRVTFRFSRNIANTTKWLVKNRVFPTESKFHSKKAEKWLRGQTWIIERSSIEQRILNASVRRHSNIPLRVWLRSSDAENSWLPVIREKRNVSAGGFICHVRNLASRKLYLMSVGDSKSNEIDRRQFVQHWNCFQTKFTSW